MSQPAVFYRYQRSRERLDVWALLPPITPQEVLAVLVELGARVEDARAMSLYVETNSQSEVARRLEVSQGWVRTAIFRCVEKHLTKASNSDDRHVRVRTACLLLVKNPGLFSEVNNPAIRHLAKDQEKSHKLITPPKTSPVPEDPSLVQIEDGLYRKMVGSFEELNPNLVSLRLRVVSQKLWLQWPK